MRLPTVGAAEEPCVLVVEDEFLIRMVVADHLRLSGFSVVEAFNGDEAIAILRTRARIDLVFTDVRMPGNADGMDLLKFVRRLSPGTPVIVTSGHLSPELARSGGAAAFMGKPCDVDEITTTIRTLLEPGSS